MRLLGLALLAALLGFGMPAWAQDDSEADDPPEILSSELALKTILETEELDVTFVIVDTDRVTEVKINGEVQKIEPGDTVLISRKFRFRQDVTRVEVSATDEAGHNRTVTYTVFAPGVDPAKIAGPAKPALRIFATYDVRYEEDDNPSNDLSSPIDIEGIELVGVVPDSEQPDTRYSILATGGVVGPNWSAFAGASMIEYSKTVNEGFNVLALFVGGTYRFDLSDTAAIRAGYTFTDVDLGGFDYVQTHTVTPAFRLKGTDDEGGMSTTAMGVDIVLKQFASDTQSDTTVWALKLDYTSIDKPLQDSFRMIYAYGVASEGIEVSEFDYLSGDWDWKNRWDSGLLFDIGTGIQYRDYKNDVPLSDEFLGSTRVDIPMRLSTGIGWQFIPLARVMLNYRYTFNLSNKQPYTRQIYGISVNGTF